MLCITGFSWIISTSISKALVFPFRHTLKYCLCSAGVKPNTSIREEAIRCRSHDEIGQEVTMTEHSLSNLLL